MITNKKVKLKYLSLDKLKFNKKHIRLKQFNKRQTNDEIIKYYYNYLSIKNLILSIGQNGYFGIEPLIVIKDKNKYKVLDGNLRLASLRILNNPTIVDDSINKILNETIEQPIEIPCLIINKYTNVNEMIGYKHINNSHSWNISEKIEYIIEYYKSFLDDDIQTNTREVAISIGIETNETLSYVLTAKILLILNEYNFFNIENININYLQYNFLKFFFYNSSINFLNINLESFNLFSRFKYNNLEQLVSLFNNKKLTSNDFIILDNMLVTNNLIDESSDIFKYISNQTINYYNENYQDLLKRYDSANMEQLNKILDKFIFKDSFVLDLGFGSGRDLNYIKNITKDIYGLDGSIEFVNNLKQNKFYKNKVSLSILPNIDTSLFNINKFDIIISIAVFMHLKKNEIKQTIVDIKNKLNNNGKVIISYSTKSRDDDKRDFLEITKDEMILLFNNEDFKELETISNKDSLNRKIEWVTQVYEL